MRIAIVHDALCVAGGAERLVLWMAKAFPQAPIYTSVYLPEKTFPEYKILDVRVLPFSRFVRNETQFKLLYPLWLFEFQRLDFSNYDVVLSSSSYLAKFIQPAKQVRHLAYIYAPFRLLWKTESYSQDSLPTPNMFTGILKKFIPKMRKWDQEKTQLISKIATSCLNMANEIQEKYQKTSTIIYPPVDVSDYTITPDREDYFISVSRLISHKRVDLAVKACTLLGKNLIIVGEGPEIKNLRKIAGPSVRFEGNVDNVRLKYLYSHAKALIFSSEEDFGIVPLEAQAFGSPVIAFGKGGVLETVKDGVTGIYFMEQNVESLIESIQKIDQHFFDQDTIREWANRFDVDSFITGIQNFVSSD